MRGGARPPRDYYEMADIVGTLLWRDPRGYFAPVYLCGAIYGSCQVLENIQYNTVFFLSIMGAVYVVRAGVWYIWNNV